MADMLVKLYALPDIASLITDLHKQHVAIRQARPSEKYVIADWARQRFSQTIAAECEAAIAQQPISCYIAIAKQPANSTTPNPYDLPPEKLIGFACYDVVSKGMFGPIGICETRRGQGIGKALLLTCLHAMKAERYAYAVIGWAGPSEFYEKAAQATFIEGSEPGIYRGQLVGDENSSLDQ